MKINYTYLLFPISLLLPESFAINLAIKDQSGNILEETLIGSNKSRSATESGKMKAAKWESGMDNSPMWEDAIFDSASHRMLMADVGLMSLYIVLSIADKST